MAKRSKRKLRHLSEGELLEIREQKVSSAMKGLIDNGGSYTLGQPARKSSDLLIEYAEPIFEDNDTLSIRKSKLKIAMSAWNLAMVSPEDREECLLNLFADMAFDESDRVGLLNLLDMFIERKLEFFSEYDRRMEYVKVTQRRRKNGAIQFHVEVGSRLKNEDMGYKAD